MKRLLLGLGVVAPTLSGFSVLAASASAASDLVTLKGHVTGSDGKGLAGIVVQVGGKAPTATRYTSARTRTSRTGRYAVHLGKNPHEPHRPLRGPDAAHLR